MTIVLVKCPNYTASLQHSFWDTE